jgi:hypothetical protein
MRPLEEDLGRVLRNDRRSWKVYDDRFKRFPEPVDSGTCFTVGNGKTLAVRAYKALDPCLTT